MLRIQFTDASGQRLHLKVEAHLTDSSLVMLKSDHGTLGRVVEILGVEVAGDVIQGGRYRMVPVTRASLPAILGGLVDQIDNEQPQAPAPWNPTVVDGGGGDEDDEDDEDDDDEGDEGEE